MPRRNVLLVAAAFVLAPASAPGDTLVATLGQPLFEVAHEVDVTVAAGVARFRVQRAFHNRGSIADEASLDIDLPYGGAVTGLRIKARETWYDGDLMEAEAAAKLYQELTGLGPFPVKDPALLQWVWADKVHLQVFPVLPGRDSLVEYTITVPTRYEGGRQHLSYSRDPGPGLVVPTFVLRPDDKVRRGEGELRIDNVVVAAGARYSPPSKVERSQQEESIGVERDPDASYVFSDLTIGDSERARGAIKSATVDVDLAHTFAGDLRIELVSPSGEVVRLRERDGGTKNDVREHFPIGLAKTASAVGRWRLVISDHAARDVGTLNHWRLTIDTGRGAPVKAAVDPALFISDAPEGADDRGLLDITVPAPPIETVEARLGRVVASAAHAFLRLEIDAAKEMAPRPRRASIVFAVDASHSVGPAGIDAQLATARAVLSHLPDASVEIVLFRRQAERLFHGFVPAAEVARRLELARGRGELAPGNGSALDEGLGAALAALRGRAGPRRVIVTSDAELRSRFEAAKVRLALARAPADTVVHLVVSGNLDSDEVELTRDDRHELSPLAEAGRGILATLGGAHGPNADKDLPRAVLELVRPIRLDGFQIRGVELPSDVDLPAALDEGKQVRTWIVGPSLPARVIVEGKLWAEPFRRVVEESREFSRATAAFVFSDDRHHELSHDEMMAVAVFGRAVSPVTSYIAVEPGVRPSTAGILRRSLGGGAGSGYGRGAGGLGGRGMARPPQLAPLVEPLVARCRAQVAHAARAPLSLEAETTKDEIVDVEVKTSLRALGSCVEEAVWQVRLPEAFAGWARLSFSLGY